VYAVVQGDRRASTAQDLISQGGKVSMQVLNEFVDVVRRKAKMPWDEVRFGIENIEVLCPDPLPIKMDTHHKAFAIVAKCGFRIYDALMIASALQARCSILYSEDMQDGQVIEGKLTIRNPFRA
jgi:predicted nucleic acid-binding protein